MNVLEMSVDEVLATPFPDYSWPLGIGRQWLRTCDDGHRQRAIELFRRMWERSRHALQIGQELALACLEAGRDAEAEVVLKEIEPLFGSPDEELLARWGRRYKDRGDDLLADKDFVRAAHFYELACGRYDEAYRVRRGHYPGINKASLLLIRASLEEISSRRARLLEEAKSLAGELLEGRATWPKSLADDEIWHPATEGEANLLRGKWEDAYRSYSAALEQDGVQAFHRRSMGRQVRRIQQAFRRMGTADFGPMNDVTKLFGEDLP